MASFESGATDTSPGTNRDVIPDDLVSIFHKQSCNFGFVTHLFGTEIKALYSEDTVGFFLFFKLIGKSAATYQRFPVASASVSPRPLILNCSMGTSLCQHLPRWQNHAIVKYFGNYFLKIFPRISTSVWITYFGHWCTRSHISSGVSGQMRPSLVEILTEVWWVVVT